MTGRYSVAPSSTRGCPVWTDPQRSDAEQSFLAMVLDALRRWLARVLDAVMAPWRLFRLPPDPAGVWTTQPQWNAEVDRLIGALEDVARQAWEATTDTHFVSGDSFLQAQLAMTRNLLVRIPDETYNLVFAELSDAANNGEDMYHTAQRVQRVLEVSGSELWPRRAETIAITETNRAGNAASLAAGFQTQQILGERMFKKWRDSSDRRVRPSHREADGQHVPLSDPFVVGGSPLMFPGDPAGPPQEVIMCRCSLLVVGEND